MAAVQRITLDVKYPGSQNNQHHAVDFVMASLPDGHEYFVSGFGNEDETDTTAHGATLIVHAEGCSNEIHRKKKE